jgi:putative ATP-dependent endonuclease of OLD family
VKVSRLTISNFRGIKDADLLLPNHVVLIGDNNVGKSTVLEALDLVLGPDRLGRRTPVDEHDFFQGRYRAQGEDTPPEVLIEATITRLNAEQRIRFKDYIEWWDENGGKLHTSPPPETVDQDNISHALRVAFSGMYDEEEDDFVGTTYFPKSDDEGDRKEFRKKDKQYCGFLYLRSLRTGRRALSLEHGSLLDIILRLKETRSRSSGKPIPMTSSPLETEGSKRWNQSTSTDRRQGRSHLAYDRIRDAEKAPPRHLPSRADSTGADRRAQSRPCHQGSAEQQGRRT